MNFRRSDDGTTTTLTIEGSLDAVSALDLRLPIDVLVAEKKTKIIVDLSSLRLIDSSGVGVLVSLYKRARAQGGEVLVVGLRDQPLAIFKLLRLTRLLAPSTPTQ